jgi:hypothetical protein
MDHPVYIPDGPTLDSSPNGAEGRRLALVVGVNHAPQSVLPPLHYAESDARAMAEALTERACGFSLNTVQISSTMASWKGLVGWGQGRCAGPLTGKLDIFCLTARGLRRFARGGSLAAAMSVSSAW